MALQGKVETGAYVFSDSKQSTRTVVVEWSAQQDIVNNKSIITWSAYGGGTKTSNPANEEGYVKLYCLEIKLDGEHLIDTGISDRSTRVNCYQNTVIKNKNGTEMCGEIELGHNNDGTKTFSIEVIAYFYDKTEENRYTGSKTFTLDPIARSSTITSASNITAGNKCSITWTPANADFKYRLQVSLGNWSTTYPANNGFIAPGSTNVYKENENIVVPTSALSNATSGTATATLTTYDASGNQIGSPSTKTFTVSIASTEVPTIGTIQAAVSGNYTVLAKTKGQVKVSVVNCNASEGSSIVSYTFSGPGLSQTISSSSTSASATSSIITQTGTLTYTVTVTDARGKTASGTATITCYDYDIPTVTVCKLYRCDSDNNIVAKGLYIGYSFAISYPSVNSQNSATVKFKYKKKSATSYTTSDSITAVASGMSYDGIIQQSSSFVTFYSNTEDESTYEIIMEVTDEFGGKTTYTTTTGGASRILSVRPKGKGLAVGKLAEADDTFECGWNAEFDKDVTVDGKFTVKGNIEYTNISASGNITASGLSIKNGTTENASIDNSGDLTCNNLTVNGTITGNISSSGGITSSDFIYSTITATTIPATATTNADGTTTITAIDKKFDLFTATTPGIYLVTANIVWYQTYSLGDVWAAIRVNNTSSNHAQARASTTSAKFPTFSLATTVQLKSNDILYLVVNQDAKAELKMHSCDYQIVRLGG